MTSKGGRQAQKRAAAAAGGRDAEGQPMVVMQEDLERVSLFNSLSAWSQQYRYLTLCLLGHSIPLFNPLSACSQQYCYLTLFLLGHSITVGSKEIRIRQHHVQGLYKKCGTQQGVAAQLSLPFPEGNVLQC